MLTKNVQYKIEKLLDMQRNTVKEKKKSSQQKKILRWPCGFTTAVRDIIKEQMHMMSEQMGEILAEREKL